MVKQVKTLNELDQVLNQNPNKLVIIDFFATWCGPCKVIAPNFEKLSEEFPDVTFLKVDVDQAEDAAEKYGVTAMPTFVLLKNGKPVETCVGADIQKVSETIKKHSPH
ncbi:unnamed protein product [Calicophoron daubneyi]|uniref:Thioredoxin n=1 Tax=Calicophoron daubneyi TaxID=300641 RepID=A0AAV2TKF5_CALDB